MSQVLSIAAPVVLALLAGGAVFLVWVATRKRIAATTVGRAEEDAARILRDAQRDAEAQQKELVLAGREEAHGLLRDAERQARQRQDEVATLETTVDSRKRALAEQAAAVEKREQDVAAREAAARRQEQAAAAEAERCARLAAEQQRELQRVSGMTADEAKDVLMRQIESDARRDAANLVKRLEHEARENAADKARHIITQAIQRSAAEQTVETTVSVVDLPSDDLKGRIIGREGRNIRALETATGVELIVDDTPGAIILSSFDSYRRAIAKQAIEQLVADGRIHPARIEEVVVRFGPRWTSPR